MHGESSLRTPLILGHRTYHDITHDIVSPIENKAPRAWYVLLTIAAIIAAYGVGCILYLVSKGIGTWGLNKTVDWAWDITNFVWWVGIGHAGTLISAVLLLFRQRWRMAINRSAEAMTIFAVIMAALFPMIHMGRIWLAYWVFPLPNQFGSLWVNFNSPLLWDVFAISTYFSVSVVFWYIGLIPDFATIRDRVVKPWQKKMYALLAFGWTGNAKAWTRFEEVSLVLAGLATPLVFSVHSVVSMDFATSVIPGWHATIFPPYFVAGAVFSGFGMVMTLLILTRKVMAFERYITRNHLGAMAKILLLTGTIVGFCYATELFVAWYGGNLYERAAFWNRATGPYAWAYWTMITCNLLVPQTLWSRRVRASVPALFVISLLVNVGMWFERFVIIVTSLHRDFLPSSWSMYRPTVIEVAILIGSFGLFFTLFLLFVRVLPILSIWEIKGVAAGQKAP